jgi:arsenate reductase
VEFEEVDYTKEPLTKGELKDLLRALGMSPRDLLRKRDPAYKELGLKDPDVSDEAILKAMAAHPGLIERPIAKRGDRVILGRPPEQVLELL